MGSSIPRSKFRVRPLRPHREITPSVNELFVIGGEDFLHNFVSPAKSHNVKDYVLTPLEKISFSPLNCTAIVDYDVWGHWLPPIGPNAPLNDAYAQRQRGSASSAVKA